jgi:mono/diheme cytochrome c family protein
VSGDGRGPTVPWVHPHPRDYRQGQFKFMSTTTGVPTRKPRRADLVRVLHQGIDGTSMPAFGLLPDDELQYLASYVLHLSLRGEVEYDTMVRLMEKTALIPYEGTDGEAASAIAHHVHARTAQLLVDWARSNREKPIEPPAYAEPTSDDEKQASIRAGHKLFVGKAACIACHTDFGRQTTYRYDNWGTLVKPYNLTANTYRGGRRPIDMYYRIKGGIVPSGMPAQADLTPEEYWQLVNFIKALPYPAMLPEDVRQAVYGASELKKAEK